MIVDAFSKALKQLFGNLKMQVFDTYGLPLPPVKIRG